MSETAVQPRKPATWVFLALIAATALSAAISISMIAAPQMLSGHDGSDFVRFFLALGAVYLGMPVTWVLGLCVIAAYPRQGTALLSRGTMIASGIWTIVLAIPYVAALLA